MNGENEFCFRVCREIATAAAAHRGARETGRNRTGGDLFMASLYSSSLRRSCCGGSRLTFHVPSRFFQLFELLFWWRIALGCAGLISHSYNPPSASWRGSRRVSEIHAPTKDPERDANKDAKNTPLLIRFLLNSLVIYGGFVACLLYDTNCFLLEEPPIILLVCLYTFWTLQFDILKIFVVLFLLHAKPKP